MIKEMLGMFLATVFIGGSQPERPTGNPETIRITFSEIKNQNPAYQAPLRVTGTEDALIVDLRSLHGMKLGNLNAWYLGYHGKSPEFGEINFVDNLEDLWERKLRRKVTPATKASYQTILTRYQTGDRGLTDLPGFVAEADTEARAVHASLDYDRFCQEWDERVRTSSAKEKRYLHTGGCSLLKDMTARISGRDLVAYGMTELFPSRKGEVNVRLINVLLKNAGSEYLHSIPALGDKYFSLGFYQFTSFAVRHDDSGAHGASMVNLSVDPSVQLTSGSVVGLKGKEHHRAAYLFAVYNIANWIRFSTPAERNELRRLFPSNMDQVAQFMAVSHHLPGPAIQKARKWVKDGGKKPLVKYLGPSLTIYAKKSSSNRAALDAELD
jgi:hypothetical protein